MYLDKQIVSFALSAFDTLEIKGFLRIDTNFNFENRPNFIEANLVPSITPDSRYFANAGILIGSISYESVVLRIVELALSRRSLIVAI